MNLLFLLLLLNFISIVVSQICEATNGGTCYYIAVDGSNQNDGSFGSPFSSALPAVRQAAPGDVIYFRGGTYRPLTNAYEVGSNFRSASSATECASHEVFVDSRCNTPFYSFIGLLWNFGGYGTRGQPFTTASGTAAAPITIRGYPNEDVLLDASDDGSTNFIQAAVDINGMSHWTVSHVRIKGAPVSIGGEGSHTSSSIAIEDCEVFEMGLNGGGNPGLIKVHRGGQNGIFIRRCSLHDLWDSRIAGSTNWADTSDYQHYAALTTLSNDHYIPQPTPTTGRVELIDCTIYRVPQLMFLKNCGRGPIVVRGCLIHDSVNLGDWQMSNIWFENNIAYNINGGFGRPLNFGQCVMVPENVGRNWTIVHNTFIGFKRFADVGEFGGHTIRRNILHGITQQAAFFKDYVINEFIATQSADFPSVLTSIDMDDNCYLSPDGDQFQHTTRKDNSFFNQYTLADVRQVYGLELQSIVTADSLETVFVNPSLHDYSVRAGHMCATFGAGARAGGPTTSAPTPAVIVPPSPGPTIMAPTAATPTAGTPPPPPAPSPPPPTTAAVGTESSSTVADNPPSPPPHSSGTVSPAETDVSPSSTSSSQEALSGDSNPASSIDGDNSPPASSAPDVEGEEGFLLNLSRLFVSADDASVSNGILILVVILLVVLLSICCCLVICGLMAKRAGASAAAPSAIPLSTAGPAARHSDSRSSAARYSHRSNGSLGSSGSRRGLHGTSRPYSRRPSGHLRRQGGGGGGVSAALGPSYAAPLPPPMSQTDVSQFHYS